jgi:hypothetical protein
MSDTEFEEKTEEWREVLGVVKDRPWDQYEDRLVKGMKLVFSCPGCGYITDQENADKMLDVGVVYTVRSFEISSWYTYIRLEEVPGTYNSVMFEEAQ